MLDLTSDSEFPLESLTFTLLLAAIATYFLTLGPWAPFSAKAQAWAKQRLAILGTILVALGATPLVANQLEAMDLMNWLPPAFEWPSGFAPVASTPSGIHVVSLIPSARIQIYDRDWHFIRGWNVGTFGAGFYATPLAADRIEVAPEHGPRQYVFSLSGNLVAVENHPAIHSQILMTLTKAQYVPTRWWLFPISEPLWSITVWGIGMGLLGLAWWKNKRQIEGRSANPATKRP